VKSGSLPGEQMDTARSSLKQAEAKVAAMKTGADDYEIRAPWDGVVSHVWSMEGGYVSPRENLLEIYAPESLIVRFFIPEQEALTVHAGQSVQVSLDAYAGRSFKAEIIRVYPKLERMTRTLTAEAALRDEIKLLSGMFARVETPVQTIKDAVVVPESALVILPDGTAAAFVIEGEIAMRRKVKVALEAGGFIAVAGGIEPGEMVVTRGHDMLKDGVAVQVIGQQKKKEAGSAGESGKTPAPEEKGNSKQ
jgi:membrane fusion protein (multidrug efflux system)